MSLPPDTLHWIIGCAGWRILPEADRRERNAIVNGGEAANIEGDAAPLRQ